MSFFLKCGTKALHPLADKQNTRQVKSACLQLDDWPVRQPAAGMSPYGRSRPANGDSSRKSSSSSSRRSRSLTSSFLFLFVCLMMAFSPPPFFTFSRSSAYLPGETDISLRHVAWILVRRKRTSRSRRCCSGCWLHTRAVGLARWAVLEVGRHCVEPSSFWPPCWHGRRNSASAALSTCGETIMSDVSSTNGTGPPSTRAQRQSWSEEGRKKKRHS